MKKVLYNFLTKYGVKILIKFFPEDFASQPLKPLDRFIECPFIARNLPAPPLNVLDVGCSTSFFPLVLSGFGYKVTGLDLRDYAILRHLQFDNFTFTKGDICNAPFPDNSFEVVTLISTLEHIGVGGRYGIESCDDADKQGMGEVRRLLKQGGAALITIPAGMSAILKPYQRVYDSQRISYISEGFDIVAKEYYIQDSDGDWLRTDESTVDSVNVVNPSCCPLCFLKLVKK